MIQRRQFSTAAACAAAACALHAPAWAQKKPQEGVDYRAVDRRVASEAPAGKIEVIEFFWYSCPHCHAFEPKLAAWIKQLPADVVIRRVPVAFRDEFVPQQRLFYALEGLNRLGDLHAKVFHAIHVERLPLNREDAIVAWVEKQGVDRVAFTQLYNSFSVSAKARRATQLQEGYRVEGVPSLGIAGRYYTDGGMTGTMERALQVADYLLAELRKGA